VIFQKKVLYRPLREEVGVAEDLDGRGGESDKTKHSGQGAKNGLKGRYCGGERQASEDEQDEGTTSERREGAKRIGPAFQTSEFLGILRVSYIKNVGEEGRT